MRMIRSLIFPILLGVIVLGISTGRLKALQGGAPPQAQQSGTTIDDCAACHDEVAKAFQARNPHFALLKSPYYKDKVTNPCESCHGPGKAHLDAAGDKTKIITFKGKNAKIYNKQCLGCHAKTRDVNAFSASMHGKQGLDCADCHSIHKAAPGTRQLKQQSSTLCVTCHTLQKAQFSKPYRHRVLETARQGSMDCSDCHQPHSGIEWRQVRTSFSGEEICYKCHIEIKGPFVWEHPALRLRGCRGCHEPHGSNNPKLLVRSTMVSLCMECHSQVIRSSAVFTSEPPSFHNLNSPTYRQCTACHVKVHGSNFDAHLLR